MRYTKQHNSENIKREISAIIRELKDPRLKNGFISVAKIEVTEKNSSCRVFISALEGYEFAVEAAECLKSAAGYIRKKLGERVSLRYTPTLVFIPTDSMEYGANILKKINDLNFHKIEEKKLLNSLNEVADVLEKMDNIHIVTHAYPDGDALGSAFALCRMFQKLGKRSAVVLDKKMPKKFEFMTNYVSLQDFDPDYILAVDLADTSLLGTTLQSEKVNLCIDHHISNKNFAEVNYVDPSSAATAEIIYDLIRYLNLDLDEKIAEALYIGIASDTGCFKYSNTTHKSHEIASELMKQNINVAKINENLFILKSKNKLELERTLYKNLEYFCDSKLAITFVTLDEMKKCEINENECDGISSIPVSINGVSIGITIREKSSDNYKVSVRTTSNQNASQIASLFGGGGHDKAAGFNISGSLNEVKNEIISTIKTNLEL